MLNVFKLKTNPSKSSLFTFCSRETTSDHSPHHRWWMRPEMEGVYSAKFHETYLHWGLIWDWYVDNVFCKLSSDIYVQTAVKILSDSGSDDGILWHNVLTPLLQIGLVERLRKDTNMRGFFFQEKCISLISNLHQRESCRLVYTSRKPLSLPCLHILDICILFNSKVDPVRGMCFNYVSESKVR